jgi:hypothetical protein
MASHQHVQAVNRSFQSQFLGGLSRLPQPVLQTFHPEHEEPRRPRASTRRLSRTVCFQSEHKISFHILHSVHCETNCKCYQYNTKYIVLLLLLIEFVMQMPLAVRQAVCMCHPFGRTPGTLALQKSPFANLSLLQLRYLEVSILSLSSS